MDTEKTNWELSVDWIKAKTQAVATAINEGWLHILAQDEEIQTFILTATILYLFCVGLIIWGRAKKHIKTRNALLYFTIITSTAAMPVMVHIHSTGLNMAIILPIKATFFCWVLRYTKSVFNFFSGSGSSSGYTPSSARSSSSTPTVTVKNNYYRGSGSKYSSGNSGEGSDIY